MKPAMLIMTVWLFLLPGIADASTATCSCEVRSANRGVKVFEPLFTYKGMFPVNTANQNDCEKLCGKRAASWVNGSPAEVCQAFKTAKSSASLKAFAHVGNKDWAWSGSSITMPTPSKVVLSPRYYLMTILYAVPGCSSTSAYPCTQQNTAEYENGTSTSNTISIEHSFKSGQEVTADASESFPLGDTGLTLGISMSASDEFSVTSTSGSSVTVSKKSSTKLTANPSTVDGIDHDWDEFELMLNPAIVEEHNCSKYGNATAWSMGHTPPAIVRQKLTVCQILGTCPPTPAWLATAKFAPSDYCALLKQDHFAPQCKPSYNPVVWPATVPASALDPPNLNIDPAVAYPGQFAVTTFNLSYDAPGSNGVCNGVIQETVANEIENSATSSSEAEITSTASQGATLSAAEVFSLGLKQTDSVTFTRKVSQANTRDSSQSATVTMGCAGANWDSNPNFFENVSVYWDKIFGTFLFWPAPYVAHRVIHAGHVTTPLGTPVTHQLVQLVYGGKTYHTFTNRLGDYKIYSSAVKADAQHPLPAKLTVGGVNVDVILGAPTVTAVRIPAKASSVEAIRPMH